MKAKTIINAMIEKYEILRTSIEIVNSIPMQKVHDNAEIDIKYKKIIEFS